MILAKAKTTIGVDLEAVPFRWRQQLRRRRDRSWFGCAPHVRDRLEVLGNHGMTHSSLRAWLAGCAVAASVVLVTSCASGGGDTEAVQASSSAASNKSQTASGASEKRFTEQAQAALATVLGGRLVEAGAERVTEGIHTEPSLSEGKVYRLDLVCVGKGTAQLTFTPTSAGTGTEVPCDQSVVQRRIVVHKPIRIDVDGAKGSTGVIAWQIDAV